MIPMIEYVGYFLAGGVSLAYLVLTLNKKVKWKEYASEDDQQLGVALLIFLFSLPTLLAWVLVRLFQ